MKFPHYIYAGSPGSYAVNEIKLATQDRLDITVQRIEAGVPVRGTAPVTYRGSGTVWRSLASGSRPSTGMESALADVDWLWRESEDI